jgi:cation diffusion facilitator family transporter
MSEQIKGKMKVGYMKMVLTMSVLILIIKFLAWYLTGSAAIFSDALESIVNVISGSLALYGVYYASLPKDKDHPYGHGKIEFIIAGLEGGMVLFAAFVMIIKGVIFALDPQPLEYLSEGLMLIIFAGFLNGITGLFLMNKGRSLESPALLSEGKHLLTDTISSIGLIIGLLFIRWTDITLADGILSVILGLWMLYIGYGILHKSIHSLLDKSDENKIQDIIQVLIQHKKPEWIDIHHLRIQRFGSSYHVDCHVTLPWYSNLEKSHEYVTDIITLISDHFGEQVEMFIHSDPCIPSSCNICTLSECEHRKHEFIREVPWDLETIQRNQKHALR